MTKRKKNIKSTDDTARIPEYRKLAIAICNVWAHGGDDWDVLMSELDMLTAVAVEYDRKRRIRGG